MFVCLDLETTGLDPKKDHVIEVAILHFDGTKIHKEWSSLVKAPIPIPAFTSKLTGITDDMLKDAPTLDELKDEILERLADYPIMGHFIPFDTGFLRAKGFSIQNPELDSCELAQVLLRKEPSYSLEVLGKKLGLIHEDAHRALDDVKANINLYWRLREHLKAFPQEAKTAMEPILKKSDWAWAPHLLPLLKESGGKLIKQTQQTQSEAHSESHCSLSPSDTPFLAEAPTHTYQDLIEYALKLDNKAALILPNLRLTPSHPDIGLLKEPQQYLDAQRLEQFLGKESLDKTESLLGLKCRLWQLETESGDKAEIRLQKEEKNAWFDICAQEGDSHESFYTKAKKAAQDKKLLVLSHQHFLKDRSRQKADLQLPKHICITQVEQFLKNIEYAWHIRLSESRFITDLLKLDLENLANKVTICFGLLGMIIEQYGETNDPRRRLIIQDFHRNTLEWKKVTEAARSIESALTEIPDSSEQARLVELKRYLNYLCKILHSPGPILWLTQDRDQQPIVHSFPEKPSQLFQERIWKGLEKLHLFCHHGNLKDDFQFLKTELGLPEETLTTESEQSALPIEVFEDLPRPKDPSHSKQCVHTLSQNLPADGNIMVLVNSAAAAEQFYHALQKLSKEEDRPLFVQNLGGGMGKIFMLSQESMGRNIYVGNEFMLQFLLDKDVKLKLLTLTRIPFAHPNDPITKARSQGYTDAYKQYTLPQASLRVSSIFSQFLGNEWQGKKILIMDPRYTWLP